MTFSRASARKRPCTTSPPKSRLFYAIIAIVTVLAVLVNWLGFHPMKMLVWSGIIQGFSVPVILVLMLIITNDGKMMGNKVNSFWTNLLGCVTALVTALAAIFLVVTWIV